MSESAISRVVRLPARLTASAFVAGCGLAVGFEFAAASMKMRAALAVAVVGVTIVMASKHRVGLLLAAWIIMLTYNRQYFSFDGVYGDYDSQGLYWIPADLALVALAAAHAFTVWRRGRPLVSSAGLTTAFVPFLFAAALATITAAHPAWGFAEWLRLAKFGVVLLLLQQLTIGTAWWMALGALGLAVAMQSSLGALQVALNTTTGLLSMFTGGGPSDQTIVAGLNGGDRARASGTMVHPNILGPYLLFLVPIFFALFMGATHRWVRWAAAAVCAAGYAGLIGTMSRLPIAVGATQAGAVLVALVVMKYISANKALTVATFTAIAVGLFSLIFSDAIAERFSGDLSQSFEFRAQYNKAAIAMWKDHPVTGIGLNNFNAGLRQKNGKLSGIVDDMQENRKKFGVRATAPVHNLYLLILAETGVLGLIGFTLFLGASLLSAWRSTQRAAGLPRLVCLGIAIGIAGQCLQQMMDFSMWMDPGLFTFALLLAIGVNATRTAEVDDGAPGVAHGPTHKDQPFWPGILPDTGSGI